MSSSALARRQAARRPAVATAAVRDRRAEEDYRRGLALAARQEWTQAARAYRSAVDRNPDDAVFWLNLAHALVRTGELEQAADAARRAVALDPKSELGVSIATQCLAASNRHDETIEMLGALDLDRVKEASPLLALGDALMAKHKYRDAIGAYMNALKRKPDCQPAHVHLANAFERVQLHQEARECLKTALALGGSAPAGLRAAMAYHAQHACRWGDFAEDIAALQEDLSAGSGQPVPFHLLTMPSTRAQQRAAGHAYWMENCGAIAPMSGAGPRTAGARIRVGYVSNDIFRHATAYLIADLIESHNRSRFDVFLYSYSHDDASAIRQRIIAAAGDGFVEASRMSDRELAERIRDDSIDILVDLKGYTLGTRVGVFARHPGRVQVNYLGYPGTTGAPCYEYIVGDRFITPLEHAADYSEKIAQLPHCYQPNDRRRPIGARPSRAECGLPEDAFVFCSFNNCYKITAPVFDRWARILHAVPGSVLWLYEANAQARPNLLREAQQRGIDPARIVWAPHRELADHLGRLRNADLVLDTLPVNAHTTASDALWAGVPVITTPGETLVSRVAASILEAAGLPDLVTPDADAYERLAVELARDPARLQGLRQRLAESRDACPLFDSAQHTRDLEHLYEEMIEAWDQGRAPAHLPAG
jgi:protein O-GlcNAc transferase